MSLRARVLAGAALIAVVLVVGALAVTRATRSHLIDQVDTQLRDARVPVRGLEIDGAPGGPGGRPDGRPQLSSLYVALVRPNGTVIALSRPDLRGGDLPAPEIDPDEATEHASSGDPFTVGGSGSRYRVLASVAPRNAGTVVIAAPLDDVDDAVRRLLAVEAIAIGLALTVLGLVAWWVVHLGVRPIKRMTATASAIAGGELSHRVPDADPRTEAGQLGVALNQMLGSIEDAFDQQARSESRLRQFVADASHELRTPVTTIRGYAELYRSGGLDDSAELAEAMRRTEQEAVRMGALVDDLLELARLDQGRPLARDRVDLAQLAADAVRDARAVAPDRLIGLDTTGGEEPIVVEGDDARLRQVVANLVGNAVQHTQAPASVIVRVDRRDGLAVLEVADDGPGMTSDVASRAFERFYRADPSRSRHRGGAGLGLAIVEATVRAHGGAVDLVTAPGEGTTVRVSLPVDRGRTPSNPIGGDV